MTAVPEYGPEKFCSDKCHDDWHATQERLAPIRPRLEAAAREAVSNAPPLSAETKDYLASIFREARKHPPYCVNCHLHPQRGA